LTIGSTACGGEDQNVLASPDSREAFFFVGWPFRGAAMNIVLPARGGDIAKVLYLRDREEPLGPLFAAAIVERAIDVTGLATLALVASIYADWPTGAWIASFVVSLAIMGTAVVAMSKTWSVIPNTFRQTMAEIRNILVDPRTGLRAYPLALLT
jgi:hypothetical protein